jgi:hypothetical protein
MGWRDRIARIWAGGLSLLLIALLAPPSVVACSCAMMDAREQLEGRGDAALVVGQVMRDRGDGSFDFAVARWYGGQDRRAVVVLQSAMQGVGGNVAFNSCGMTFTMGQRLLFLGAPLADGRYAPGICGLSADPASTTGADYERLAAQLIGSPVDPRPQPTGPAPDAIPGTGLDLGWVAGGMGAAVALLFAGVIVLARRRRGDPT